MNEISSSRPQPMILFYNAFFGAPPDVSHLAADDQAVFSWDRSRFAEADAVVFHVPDLVYNQLKGISGLQKQTGQLWVAWSMESAVNYPILKNPAFIGLFDLVMSYERTAEIWASYYPPRARWLAALSKPLPMKTEKAAVVMFQSASPNRSNRYEFAAELMTKIEVDSYGRILKNKTLPEADKGRPTKLATIARYKFCLGLENALENDYVTEKFFDPLLVGTVPIYRGAPNIDRFAPGEHAFINANDFAGPAELADFVKQLDNDDTAYRRYFNWRERPLLPSFEADLDAQDQYSLARLVEAVRRHRQVWPRATPGPS